MNSDTQINEKWAFNFLTVLFVLIAAFALFCAYQHNKPKKIQSQRRNENHYMIMFQPDMVWRKDAPEKVNTNNDSFEFFKGSQYSF